MTNSPDSGHNDEISMGCLPTNVNGWAIGWMIALEPILLHIHIRSGRCSAKVKSLWPESLILSCWWTKVDLTDWTKINVGSSNLRKIAFYTWLGGYICIEENGDSIYTAIKLILFSLQVTLQLVSWLNIYAMKQEHLLLNNNCKR